MPTIITNLFTPRKYGNGYFYQFWSSASSFNEVEYLKAYLEIPEVSAVINMKARAFSNMMMNEVDKEGNPKPTPEGQALIKLLTNPNWFQAGKEFMIQSKTFREIYGNEYIYSQLPMGFKPDINRVKQMFTISPNIVKSEYKDKIPFFLIDKTPKLEYKVKLDGNHYTDVATEQIIHLNDNRVSMKDATDDDILKGESKLKSLSVAVNNMRMAYEARGIVLEHRGANGAWVNKSKDAVGQSLPMTAEDKENLQEQNKKYGTRKGQYQTIVTDQDLAWVQSGTNDPMKLGLFQEIEEDFNKVLDGYGVPSEVFVRTKGATYENQRQAEKGLYVRTIIPEANDWISGISSQYLKGDTTIKASYSHLPIFQEDLKMRADALNSMVTALSKLLQDGAITIQEYQSELTKFGIKK